MPAEQEKVNWIPIGVWLATAAVQLGTALFDGWKAWRNRRRTLTGYEKVQKGETVDGWRIAVSASNIYKKHIRCRYYFVETSWPPENGNDGQPSTTTDPPLSLLLTFTHELPNGRTVLFLSRYSLISGISADIFRVIYEDDFVYKCSSRVSDRIVAVAFGRNRGGQHLILLINLILKSYRAVVIYPPARVLRWWPCVEATRRNGLC